MTLSRADIDRAFQNSLGRAPSQQDEGAFLFASQFGDASDSQLYAAISNSREADLIADPVVRFYQAAFGRVPDAVGLDNATDYIRQLGATVETYQKLADMFVQSPEFQARFGSGTTVDAAYVQALYSTILNREPSAAEIQGYVTGSNGYDTRGEVLYAIAQSPEAIRLTDNAVNSFLLHAAAGDAVYTGALIPDTLAPQVHISLADASLEAGQTTQVTFDFTEQVTGFDLTDVTTTRGSLSALVQSQTDPTIYTATLTAGSSGTGQIALTGAYTDAAGNAGRGGEADFSVEATPVPVNRAPTAVNDSYNTNEDTTLVVPVRGVLANDTDPDGNAITAVPVNGPAHGTLALNADGSFSYTPDANYFGTDTFTYRANDGSADSAPATVNLTINAVNDVPIANPDSYITNEDTPLIIPAGRGVLANDTDADGDALAIGSYSQPQHGTLTANPDGSLNYVPNANYFGTDTFTYTATDGSASSAPATVILTVSAVNDAPVVTTSNQALAYTENQAPAAIDPTVSVADVDDNNLASATVKITGNFVRGEDILSLSNFTISSTVDSDGYYRLTTPGYNTISVKFDNDQGSISFRGLDSKDHYQDVLRAVSYSNTSDDPSAAQRTVTFTASDDDAATSPGATHAIQITPVNDRPFAIADSFTVQSEGGQLDTLAIIAENILTNDIDLEGDRIIVDRVISNGEYLNTTGPRIIVDGMNYPLTVQTDSLPEGVISQFHTTIDGRDLTAKVLQNGNFEITDPYSNKDIRVEFYYTVVDQEMAPTTAPAHVDFTLLHA